MLKAGPPGNTPVTRGPKGHPRQPTGPTKIEGLPAGTPHPALEGSVKNGSDHLVRNLVMRKNDRSDLLPKRLRNSRQVLGLWKNPSLNLPK